MQKIEVVMSGPEEEICSKMINNLTKIIMRYYAVHEISSYCGPAPLKAGHGELLIPEFMQIKPMYTYTESTLPKFMQNNDSKLNRKRKRKKKAR